MIIVIAGLTGSLLGLTYSLLVKPRYTAEFSFALEDDKLSGGLGGALGIASQLGFDLGGGGGGAFEGDNLMELMKSRLMMEKTLLMPVTIEGKRQTLAERYIEFNELRDGWESKPKLANLHFPVGQKRETFSLQQDSLLGIFCKKLIQSNFQVDKRDKKLSIISVRVTSTDELFSKNFVEILVNEVSQFYRDTKTKKSAQNLAILQHQTDSVRNELNAAISGVATKTDQNPNPNSALQVLRVPSQRRQVDVQANTAILAELVKNLEVSKVALRRETPLIQPIDRPRLPLEKEKVRKAYALPLGGIIAGILAVAFLVVRRLLKEEEK